MEKLKDKHSIRVIGRAIHFIEQFCKEDTGLKEHIKSELAGLLLDIPEEQPSAPVSAFMQTRDLTDEEWLKLPKEEILQLYKNCYELLIQFTSQKSDQRQVEISDEEIEKWALVYIRKHHCGGFDSTFPDEEIEKQYQLVFQDLCNAAKWMREQGKGIDLREEFALFAGYLNNNKIVGCGMYEIDEYLKIKPQ